MSTTTYITSIGDSAGSADRTGEGLADNTTSSGHSGAITRSRCAAANLTAVMLSQANESFVSLTKYVEEDMQRADDMQRRRKEEAKPWMDKASYSLEVEKEEIAVAAEMENRRSKHARTVFQASS